MKSVIKYIITFIFAVLLFSRMPYYIASMKALLTLQFLLLTVGIIIFSATLLACMLFERRLSWD